MLQAVELGLIEKIKASQIGAKLRQIAALPDVDGASLVKAFATDAPGVYIATDNFTIENMEILHKFSVAAVVRNAKSAIAPRHGDGVQLGLYDLVQALLPVLYASYIEGFVLYPTAVQWVKDKVLYDNGIEVAEITLEARVTMENGLDGLNLDNFETFKAQFDIEPLSSEAEHDKWAAEPPDYTISVPELIDTLKVQP